jgi:L-amino acid N-acyltransferase
MTTAAPAWITRPAEPRDAPPIAAIYNEAVRSTVATFDTEPRSIAVQCRWLAHHDARHPVRVAEARGEIVGWSALSPWSDRRAYDGTAEVSFYVRRDWQGKGVGRRLLEEVVRSADSLGLHSVVSRIADANPVSTHLHRSLGFRSIGVMREAGFKFGRWVDVELFQRIGNPPTHSQPPIRPIGPRRVAPPGRRRGR